MARARKRRKNKVFTQLAIQVSLTADRAVEQVVWAIDAGKLTDRRATTLITAIHKRAMALMDQIFDAGKAISPGEYR